MGVERIPVGQMAGKSTIFSLLLNNNIRIYNFTAIPAKEVNTFVGLTETLDGPSIVINSPVVLNGAPKHVIYRVEKRASDVIYQKWDGGEESNGPVLIACNWWGAANNPAQLSGDDTFIGLSLYTPHTTLPLPAASEQSYAQLRQYLKDKTHWALVTSRGDGTPDTVIPFTVPDNQAANPGCGHRVALLIDPATGTINAYVEGVLRATASGSQYINKINANLVSAVNYPYVTLQIVVQNVIAGPGTAVNASYTGLTVANLDTHLASVDFIP